MIFCHVTPKHKIWFSLKFKSILSPKNFDKELFCLFETRRSKIDGWKWFPLCVNIPTALVQDGSIKQNDSKVFLVDCKLCTGTNVFTLPIAGNLKYHHNNKVCVKGLQIGLQASSGNCLPHRSIICKTVVLLLCMLYSLVSVTGGHKSPQF